MKKITLLMRTIISLSIFLLIAAYSHPGQAQARALASEVDLERTLEDRVRPLVLRYDPDALVRVNVSFRKISSPLPGTALDVHDYSGSSDSGTVRDGEISGMVVTLFSAKENIPDWLQQEISSLVPGVKPRIERKALSPEAQQSMIQNRPSDPTQILESAISALTSQARTFSLYLVAGFGGILFLGIGLGALVAFSLQKRRSTETHKLLESRLIPALNNLGQGADAGSSSRTTVVQATLSAPVGGFQGQGGGSSESSGPASASVAGLSLEALESVLSDCYWCHQDTYAAWLWSAMTPDQRNATYSSKFVDREYIKWIQSLPREKMEEHLNPVYLHPLALHRVSQVDMARWVEKYPIGFHVLSPMRQKTLPISLKTRLACAAETPDEKTKTPAFPERDSAKRILPVIQQFGELSPEDETTLLHNPLLVSESLRSHIRSLVWLALKPLDHRQKILSEHSAEALAAAWWGSEEVLARLNEALPEKKRQMLEGYLKVVEINKKTSAFGRLVDAGLDNRPYTSDAALKQSRAA
ncbi:MAG: hypothetical protein ABIO95_02985 [Bdellovibrionota bacterium]